MRKATHAYAPGQRPARGSRQMPVLAAGIAALALAAAALQAQAAPVPPAPDSAEALQFGYPSPQAALAALRAKPGVVVRDQNGWTVADDRANYAIWSFTPPGHPAHPSGVKRVFARSANGETAIVMSAKCGAPDQACEALLFEFHLLNEQMRERLRAQKPAAQ